MSRRGFTLTELIVVMGMTSVVLSIGIGLVHRVMHEQALADRDNVMHRVAERLSTRLREDVHRAERAELVQSGEETEQRLVLYQSAERTVTCVVRQNALERISTRQSEPTHRDRFQFPDNYRLAFVDVPAKQVVFTAFALPHDGVARGSDKSPRVVDEKGVRRAVMRVEASVGRDLRFLSETQETE